MNLYKGVMILLIIGDEAKKLYETIKSYEGIQIDFDHVKTWLERFGSHARRVAEILSYVFQIYFFDEDRMRKVFSSVIDNILARYNGPACVLLTQSETKSQSRILGLVHDLIPDNWTTLKNPSKYELSGQICVYVDDAIYSGNTIINELRDINAREIIIASAAVHRQAVDYIISRLGTKVKFVTGFIIENERHENNTLGTLWPRWNDRWSGSSCGVDTYLQSISERFRRHAYRQYPVSNDQLFRNPQDRNLIEQLFLVHGLQMLNCAQDPHYAMRPLGYEKLESFGFGTMFGTCFNWPNNGPLVLWYGDPNNWNPALNFFPLFPRRTWR